MHGEVVDKEVFSVLVFWIVHDQVFLMKSVTPPVVWEAFHDDILLHL